MYVRVHACVCVEMLQSSEKNFTLADMLGKSRVQEVERVNDVTLKSNQKTEQAGLIQTGLIQVKSLLRHL